MNIRIDIGKVYLVGAGPGDPDLLTLKALRLIQSCDAVVYDRLVSEEILNLIPDGVTRIDVGKRPGTHPVPQEEINQILTNLARSGRMVVRLKGGDPMVFGRGGEEVDTLMAAGILVETVPGITAAQGCAASLNLPLTQRGVASSVHYLTGHTRDDQTSDMDWARLANNQSTLVIYMGSSRISHITRKLIENGLAETTPALAICNGTLPTQRQIQTTLSRLTDDLVTACFDGPVLFFIGEAAGARYGIGATNHVWQENAALSAVV